MRYVTQSSPPVQLRVPLRTALWAVGLVATIRLYIKWIADFAKYFHTSPEHLGPRARPLQPDSPDPGSTCLLERPQAGPGALQFLYRVTLGRKWAGPRRGLGTHIEFM